MSGTGSINNPALLAESAGASTPHPSPRTPQPPEIPDHELLHRIGGGSYGEVWLARNAIGTLRAVKIVHRQSFQHADHFEREFKGLLKFEPISRAHNGLVDVLQIGRHDDAGHFYYVMELADAAAERSDGVLESRSDGRTPSGHHSTTPSLQAPASYSPRTLRSDLQARGRLPPAECVALGLKLAAALEHLHAHGLAHRDIKPSNIIFVDGEPKLADIGLVTAIDEAHSLVGTTGYIPPEGPGTPQADLYSLGKVLYEIALGKDRQDFPQLPPDLPSHPDYAALLELNEVILKACETDPRRRYASATALGEDLARLQQGRSVKRRHTAERRWGFAKKYGLATAAVTLLVAAVWLLSSRFGVLRTQRVDADTPPSPSPVPIKSIAVLPFDNESNDIADEYLGLQVAEQLKNSLKKIPGLRVLEWSSAIALKKAEDRLAAARQIKLEAVVMGSVRRTGSRVQFTARLINTADGHLVWSAQPVDGARPDILLLPSEMAEQIAAALNLNLTEAARQQLATKPTLNLAAQELYWLGRRHWNTRTPRGVESAIECFQQAIQQDSNYAQAYAGLADCYSSWQGLARGNWRLEARRNAEKAVQVGPSVSEAHASLGFILENHSLDLKGAETEFKRALELDPNNATVHSWYGIHLARLGQFEAGIREARLGQELDPLSSVRSWVLCWLLTAARQYDAAIEQFEKNLRLPPSQPARQRVGDCYFYRGLYEEGIAAFEKAAISNGQDPQQVAQRYESLRRAYLKSGTKGYWQRSLEMALAGSWQEGNDPINIAVIHAWLGDKEQTLAWLEKGAVASDMRNVNLTPVLDLVRSEPRYRAVLKKMGLPEPVWKE